MLFAVYLSYLAREAGKEGGRGVEMPAVMGCCPQAGVQGCIHLSHPHDRALSSSLHRTISMDNIGNGAGKERMLQVVSIVYTCTGGEGVWVCGSSPRSRSLCRLGAEDTYLESSSLLKSGSNCLKDLETDGCRV